MIGPKHLIIQTITPTVPWEGIYVLHKFVTNLNFENIRSLRYLDFWVYSAGLASFERMLLINANSFVIQNVNGS